MFSLNIVRISTTEYSLVGPILKAKENRSKQCRCQSRSMTSDLWSVYSRLICQILPLCKMIKQSIISFATRNICISIHFMLSYSYLSEGVGIFNYLLFTRVIFTQVSSILLIQNWNTCDVETVTGRVQRKAAALCPLNCQLFFFGMFFQPDYCDELRGCWIHSVRGRRRQTHTQRWSFSWQQRDHTHRAHHQATNSTRRLVDRRHCEDDGRKRETAVQSRRGRAQEVFRE